MSADQAGQGTVSTVLRLHLRVDSRKLGVALAIAVVLLMLGGLAAEVANSLRWSDPLDLIDLFGLSYEENLPTWYSSMLLFSSALVLGFIAAEHRLQGAPDVLYWQVLAGLFVLISLDEIAQRHEEISNFFDFGGVLYYGWVIPAALFVSVFGLSYLRFLSRLPRGVAIRMWVSGGLYVLGALVMELPLGYWAYEEGRDNLVYGLIDLVEESLEIIGLSFFLHTMVGHLASLTEPGAHGQDEAAPGWYDDEECA